MSLNLSVALSLAVFSLTQSKLRGEQTVLEVCLPAFLLLLVLKPRAAIVALLTHVCGVGCWQYGANKRLLTCALRPHAIFGPRDPHFWTALAEVGRKGKSKAMVGDGTNLVDSTYVENVAYSHVLAAARLGAKGYESMSGQVGAGVACLRVVTIADLCALHCMDGQAYFITNREPHLFWDMVSWAQAGFGWAKPWIIIPSTLLMVVARLLAAVGIKATFTKQSVSYASTFVDHHNRSFSASFVLLPTTFLWLTSWRVAVVV
jgi:hypothetical protein